MTSPATPQADPQQALAEAMEGRLRQALLESVLQVGSAGPSPDQPALTVERSAEPIAPQRLAAGHPGGRAARDEMAGIYRRCLDHYRQVVRPQDLASGFDDVGAAVAAFVAANIGALQDLEITPATLLRLERQLVGVVRRTAAWDDAPARERQAYFEQMAVLAVFVAETSAQARTQGAAALANVRGAARGYLQRLLGLDPDHLTLGPEGLAARAPLRRAH